MGANRTPTLIVGVGASAGGLEAIDALFGHMPPNCGMAFVVIQHLSPDYKSLMVELLSRRTHLEVKRAEDGVEVEVDTIYLITPKKNLTLFHGKLYLRDPDPDLPLNLPIDIFFQSLAEDQGSRAVGVILSGTGSDGTRGLRAIKERGGVVMVHEPEHAKFDGMPKSAISTGLADFVLDPDRMPEQLLALARHPIVASGDEEEPILGAESELERLFALLRDRTSVDFTHYKPTTVKRRIERRMTINLVGDLAEYVRYVETYPAELKYLHDDLLIGVTEFFRDLEAWQGLADRWLPELIRRSRDREVRFWVSGCSTGEEAYSLAMLARRAIDQVGRQVSVRIFATDINADAIVRAGNGIYPESIVGDLPTGMLSRFFVRDKASFRISREIREMVVFARHDLIRDPPFTNISLLTCRNLLIYLQPVLQKRVLEFMSFSLNPGGLLFLGSSETTGELVDHFEVLEHKWKIYRTRGKRYPTRIGVTPPAGGRQRSLGQAPWAQRAPMVRSQNERVLERFIHGISEDVLPSAIIVRESGEVLHTFGSASRFLTIPSGPMQNDLSRLVHPDLAIPLATGLQRALQQEQVVRYTNIHLSVGEMRHKLEVRILPLPGRRGQEPLGAILIQDLKPPAPAQDHEADQTYDLDREAERRITDLEQELSFTRENLQATIEELETTNEELQATNEELLASNEELQSTNEELQSVNEELHTVNSEHQMRILELAEAQNDLDDLIRSSEVAAVFLDENLDVRRYTPRATELFDLHVQDIGRPLLRLKHSLDTDRLAEWVDWVVESAQPRDEAVADRLDRRFRLHIQPYRVAPGVFSGVSLTFFEHPCPPDSP